MKKYVKPELFYESFELAEQIAAGCSGNLLANYGDENTCEVNNFNGTGLTIFASGNGECKDKISDGFEGYCYHNGSAGFTIFSS